MDHRLEGEVATLPVEGELVDVQLARADQHLVILHLHATVAQDGDVGARRGLVLLYPARQQKMQKVRLRQILFFFPSKVKREV